MELWIIAKFDSPPTNVHIMSLPEGFRAPYDIILTGIGGESYGAKSSGVIRSGNGNVMVTSDDKYVMINAVVASYY